MASVPLGDEELLEEGRTATPDLAGAPGIIEATVVAEAPGPPRTPRVPLWGPPSRGGGVALWEQARPGDGVGPGSSVEPVPLGPPIEKPRRRRTALVGVALTGAVLLLGVVAVTGWAGTDGADSVANRFGPDGPGPTDDDGRPVELPPSQPATPVSFAPTGEVVRPEPRRARVVDPRSGAEVIVDLPPGTRVDTATGQVVVRVTGTPTSIRTSTTVRPTTTIASTSSTTEGTTSTTEGTTTTTVEEPTTTTDPTIPDVTLP